MKSELPDADNLGPVGFSAALKVEHQGRLLEDLSSLPAKTVTPQRRDASWLIPDGHDLAGVPLKEGSELVVDTGPLAWRGRFELPKLGEEIDTSADEATLRKSWVLRESDYHRAKLYPAPAEIER
jgi:hypothetical protein